MTLDFESVRVLMRNPDPISHKIATATLSNQGCRQIVTTSCLGESELYLRSDMMDLVICDADDDLDEACDTVRRMRNRKDGDNSFALSIMLISAPDQDTVLRLADSGADAILVKPFQPMALAMQVAGLVRTRRPFVITSDYVGPERRTASSRPGSETAPQMVVPNPLRETAAGGTNRADLRRKVRSAWEVVNAHRIERQAARLGWLIRRIRSALAEKPPAADAGQLLAQLHDAVAELRLRVTGTGHDHVAHLAATMMDICNGLAQNLSTPDPRWLAVLPEMAEAMTAAVAKGAAAARASQRISDTVGRGLRPGGLSGLTANAH